MRIALLALLFLMAGCHRANSNALCPIDGQPAQWKGPKTGSTCEYSHYNQVERTIHTWLADCAQNVAR